jgi:hypothetical protein
VSDYGPGYHKIETLFNRDALTFKIATGDVRVPEFLAVDRWVTEEKLDGQNIRIHVTRSLQEPPVVAFNGRTDNAQLSGMVRAALEIVSSRAAECLLTPELYHDDVTLYGEMVGPKIQKNPNGFEEPTFVLFDAFVRCGETGGYWAPRDEVELWARQLGVHRPALLHAAGIEEIIDIVRHGFAPQLRGNLPGAKYAEGVICRPRHELATQRGQRVIWKLKTKDF